MSKFSGRRAAIGIAPESLRGTPVTPTYWIPWREVTDPHNKVETVKNDTSLARIESSDGYAVIGKFGEIGWKTKLKDTHFGAILKSLFGSVSSVAKASPNTSVYDHTFSVLQSNQHPTVTITYKDPNVDIAFANAMIGSLKIDAAQNNYIMYEVKTLSLPSDASTTTVAHVQENDFLPQQLVFKNANTQSGLDGASAVSIRSMSIEFSQNLLKEMNLGNTSPTDILNQDFDIKGSVTLTHSSTAYSTLQDAGTVQALRFDLIHSATIGTSANPELKIDLYKASITNYSKKVTLGNMTEESFDFEAHYSLADSKMVAVTLTNLATSY